MFAQTSSSVRPASGIENWRSSRPRTDTTTNGAFGTTPGNWRRDGDRFDLELLAGETDLDAAADLGRDVVRDEGGQRRRGGSRPPTTLPAPGRNP